MRLKAVDPGSECGDVIVISTVRGGGESFFLEKAEVRPASFKVQLDFSGIDADDAVDEAGLSVEDRERAVRVGKSASGGWLGMTASEFADRFFGFPR